MFNYSKVVSRVGCQKPFHPNSSNVKVSPDLLSLKKNVSSRSFGVSPSFFSRVVLSSHLEILGDFRNIHSFELDNLTSSYFSTFSHSPLWLCSNHMLLIVSIFWLSTSCSNLLGVFIFLPDWVLYSFSSTFLGFPQGTTWSFDMMVFTWTGSGAPDKFSESLWSALALLPGIQSLGVDSSQRAPLASSPTLPIAGSPPIVPPFMSRCERVKMSSYTSPLVVAFILFIQA